MKWSEMDEDLAGGNYDMAVSGWSHNDVASPRGVQIAMEEIRAESKLAAVPDPSKAFEWSFVRR